MVIREPSRTGTWGLLAFAGTGVVSPKIKVWARAGAWPSRAQTSMYKALLPALVILSLSPLPGRRLWRDMGTR